jgi:hypothetical protein
MNRKSMAWIGAALAAILQMVGDQLVDTGKRMTLPGHPAAMRARVR